MQQKWVVSMVSRSDHLAPMACKASFESCSNFASVTAPKQTQIPVTFVHVWVRAMIELELNVPEVVLRIICKRYSVSTSRPDSFVEVLWRGFGMAESLWLFLKILSERKEDVASWIGSHSSVILVCVSARSFSSGGSLRLIPYVSRTSLCKDQKDSEVCFSACSFLET